MLGQKTPKPSIHLSCYQDQPTWKRKHRVHIKHYIRQYHNSEDYKTHCYENLKLYIYIYQNHHCCVISKATGAYLYVMCYKLKCLKNTEVKQCEGCYSTSQSSLIIPCGSVRSCASYSECGSCFCVKFCASNFTFDFFTLFPCQKLAFSGYSG